MALKVPYFRGPRPKRPVQRYQAWSFRMSQTCGLKARAQTLGSGPCRKVKLTKAIPTQTICGVGGPKRVHWVPAGTKGQCAFFASDSGTHQTCTNWSPRCLLLWQPLSLPTKPRHIPPSNVAPPRGNSSSSGPVKLIHF